MKSKLFLAFIAVALLITSIACNWFRSKKQAASYAFNIEGQWLIDSVENNSSDSSKNMGMFLMALVSKDSLPLGIAFNADSSWHFFNASDTVNGIYYISGDNKNLFIREDSVVQQFSFVTTSDSAFSVSSPDSMVYHFRKK